MNINELYGTLKLTQTVLGKLPEIKASNENAATQSQWINYLIKSIDEILEILRPREKATQGK